MRALWASGTQVLYGERRVACGERVLLPCSWMLDLRSDIAKEGVCFDRRFIEGYKQNLQDYIEALAATGCGSVSPAGSVSTHRRIATYLPRANTFGEYAVGHRAILQSTSTHFLVTYHSLLCGLT